MKEILNPENRTLKDAAIKAGYSVSENGSRHIYRSKTKHIIAQALENAGVSKEGLIGYFKEIGHLAIKTGDLSNANRVGENIGKVTGAMKDSTSTQVSVFTGDMIKDLPPIEVEPSQEGAKPSNDVSH